MRSTIQGSTAKRRMNVMSQAVLGRVMLPCVAIAWGLLCSMAAYGADKRAMSPADVLGIHGVSSPVISPDGREVLYTVGLWKSASTDPKKPGKEKEVEHVWMAPTASGSNEKPRQITFGVNGESNPAWSSDGKLISFLTERGNYDSDEKNGDKQQLWVMHAEGGEAWQLTDNKESVGSYIWSPAGDEIAYTAKLPDAKDVEEAHERGDNAQVYETNFPSLGLYVVSVASKSTTYLTPGRTFTIEGEPTWSPDGKQIAFGAKPTPMIRDYRSDVFVITIANKSVKMITDGGGPSDSPRWSPDGATIAYLKLPNDFKPLPDDIQDQYIGNDHLMLYHVATGKIEDVYSTDFDLGMGEFGFGDVAWMRDSKQILFDAGDHVYDDVFAYEVGSHKYRRLTNERDISLGSPGLSRDGATIAFTMQTPEEPSEVYVSDLSFSSPRKLTDTNPQVRDFALGTTEVIHWKSSDGLEIEGLLIKPSGYQKGKKYPLLVLVHGGPTEAHTNGFQAEEQMWAGHGWALLLPNPRGSTNYGDKFMRDNIPDLGGGDYRDIMAGTDTVVAQGIADPDRLAVEGWSYGGYMTCWIVSQTSRFKAARMGAGITDLATMQGTSDIPGYISLFFGGYPSKERDQLFRDRSGVTFASQVTTPTLILQGASDVRVPPGQALEFYRALEERGKTVQLVLYPGEGHGLHGYYSQYDRLRRSYNWIAKYTLGDDPKNMLPDAKSEQP